MNNEFDWDAYPTQNFYSDVIADTYGPLRPTMFSPDKKLIYLNSYDLVYETSDKKALKSTFLEIEKSIKEYIYYLKKEDISFFTSINKIYVLRKDYKIIADLLYGNNHCLKDMPEIISEKF